MAKVPFTPDGVQTKTHELYALTQAELDEHAYRIAADFSGWMDENFQLTTKESQFIDSLQQPFLGDLSEELASALRGKLPIFLDEPYPPITPPDNPDGTPSGSKRIRTKKNTGREYLNGQSAPLQGSYHIIIDYVTL